jgi:hypothetical protein
MGAVKIIEKVRANILFEIESHYAKKPLTRFEHGYLNGMLIDGYLQDAKFGIMVIDSYRKSCAKPGKDTATGEGRLVTSSRASMGRKSATRGGTEAKAKVPPKKPKTKLCQPKAKESSACSETPGTSSRKPRSGSSSRPSKSTARAKPATARKSATTTRKAPSRKAT